jgi:hypothetical protein
MPIDTESKLSVGAVAGRAEGWFYIGMPLTAAATAIAGFGPAIV